MATTKLLDEVIEVSGLELDRRFKFWAKYVDSVDRTQPGGFMFRGAFISKGTSQLPDDGVPRLILVCCESGSRNRHYGHYQGVRMNCDCTLEKVEGLYVKQSADDKKWAIQIADQVERYLAKIASDVIREALSLPEAPEEALLTPDELGDNRAFRAPVCADCGRIMRVRENGIYAVECYDEGMKPYKVWMADLYECSVCVGEIICGFGNHPVSQVGADDFLDVLDHIPSGKRVDFY